MPLWPFSRKRRAITDVDTAALTEKPPRSTPTPGPGSKNVPGPGQPPPSRKESRRKSPRAATDPPRNDPLRPIEPTKSTPHDAAAIETKENVRPRTRDSSDEDITALPMAKRLEHSPHLRPVEVECAPRPYHLPPSAVSQTSIRREEVTRSGSRPNTLKSKRSVHDNVPLRRQSTKKRRNDPVREEEIRAMSQPVPVPSLPPGYGDSPLRRDSKKTRGGLSGKASVVSLPPAENSIHSSTLSGIQEQRGWEIGGMGVFSPRPAVRLSGVPQYVAPSSAPATSEMARELSRREEKRPVSKSSTRKRQTIGNQVDDLDTAELRLILERDAKRRERKKKDQQEKLDKKLRSRGGRNRGDSDRSQRRREAEEAVQRARDIPPPPTAMHPAFRARSPEEPSEAAGLGFVEPQSPSAVLAPSREEPVPASQPENPFEDPAIERPVTPASDDMPYVPGAFSPMATPMIEDAVFETAEMVHMSHPATAPVSPVTARAPQRLSATAADPRRTSELITPPLVTVINPKRASDPPREATRRTGAWASFFRRNTVKRPGDDRSAPSGASFSNASRESMRNQPLPAHLVDTRLPNAQRRGSGTPSRTQSRFREDLPESFVPISPPDSRLPSPDVTTAAGLAAAARRGRFSPPVDASHPRAIPTGADSPGPGGRNDTPVSPSIRGHGLMSASLASIDSEGSWLAGGSNKRQSTQSVLSRSLSKRKQALGAASYEELGEDRDAEHFQRMTPSPDHALQQARHTTIAALTGASPRDDEESEYGGEHDPARPATLSDPLTVHASVRRKPTLVHRDPRVKSREGLLTEYAGDDTPDGEGTSTPIFGRASIESSAAGVLTDDPDNTAADAGAGPGSGLQRDSSISYRDRGHVRQISAGSARLLDLARRRTSADASAGGVSQPLTPLSPAFPSQAAVEED